MIKQALIIASCASLTALGGCSTTSAASMQPITNAIAAGLPHCHISGSLTAGVGGLAGAGTGAQQTAQFDCPAQPWPVPTQP